VVGNCPSIEVLCRDLERITNLGASTAAPPLVPAAAPSQVAATPMPSAGDWSDDQFALTPLHIEENEAALQAAEFAEASLHLISKAEPPPARPAAPTTPPPAPAPKKAAAPPKKVPATPTVAPAAPPALAPITVQELNHPTSEFPSPVTGFGPTPTGVNSGHTDIIRRNTVKVDTSKLDALVNLVGELLISHRMVADDPQLRMLQSGHAQRNLAQLARVSKELQAAVMRLRMVPIRATLDKLARVARDASHALHKSLLFDTEGGETELDRNVVEELHDPLVHMIRNAIDHGIESPAERVACGKPEAGKIRLRAYHEGGQIVVALSDDGKGLDPRKLIAKAREKGLISADAELSEQQAFQLIFAPGFSTAEKVTSLSGRGVGMDVVRSALEKIRGRIDIDSKLGEGTTFRLRLPLTLAIIDGLVARVGQERFILPCEWLRPHTADLFTVESRQEMVKVRGELSPLVRLDQLLRIEGAEQRPERATLVVVQSRGRRISLMVDELLGRQEVVIKSLGPLFQKAPCVSGGAILGDGHVALILDGDQIVDEGRVWATYHNAESTEGQAA